MKLQIRNLFSMLMPFILANHCLYSQLDDCSLDIGGKDIEVIITIFQLNEDQQDNLEKWIAEMNLETKTIEDDMRKLLDDHPQSTEADLHNLAKKYLELKDKLVLVSKIYDQKLLGTFNEKQYAYYTKLCKEALRKPLLPDRPEQEDEAPE